MNNDDSRQLLHWGGLEVNWTGGEAFVVSVPSGVGEWPSKWLEQNLPERLARVPGLENAALRVTATGAVVEDGAMSHWGSITIYPLSEPLPDPEALRGHVEAAVREAERAASIALDVAERFSQGLRRAPVS